jgi:hypothetical protein
MIAGREGDDMRARGSREQAKKLALAMIRQIQSIRCDMPAKIACQNLKSLAASTEARSYEQGLGLMTCVLSDLKRADSLYYRHYLRRRPPAK